MHKLIQLPSIWFHGRLPMNMAWEALFLFKLRTFSDGITFFELVVNTDFYDDQDEIDNIKNDHNPKLSFRLIVLNYTIFDISIYNTPPVKKEDDYQAKFKYTPQ